MNDSPVIVKPGILPKIAVINFRKMVYNQLKQNYSPCLQVSGKLAMKNSMIAIITAILAIGPAGNAQSVSTGFFTRSISPSKDLLVFPSAKGEVVFSHSKHLRSLKEDECIRCHRIENPTLKNIQSRFGDHRIAHAFCKGCHRTLEKGPTECHQCHNYKKTS
jgi:hypothetical protein